jgi:TatD DNase family protein
LNLEESNVTAPSQQYPFPDFFLDEKNVIKRADKVALGQMYKSRNEPCNLFKVLMVISAVREESMIDIASACYENTNRIFFNRFKL